jgi:putative glutamine amidotransferase
MVASRQDDVTTTRPLPSHASRPRVLVTMGAEAGRFYVGAPHLAALRGAGLVPVPVAGDLDDRALDDLAALAGAVYLPGGEWVPERLEGDGEPAAAAASAGLGWDPHKVRGDLALLRRAEARGLPALGVCGGMQAMAILAGGSLRIGGDAEIARHADGVRHRVRVDGDTRTAAVLGAELDTNSHHRQLVADPGALRAAAWADDGTLEAVERRDGPLWLGVQWHPERDADPRPFEALAQAARR